MKQTLSKADVDKAARLLADARTEEWYAADPRRHGPLHAQGQAP